MPQQIGLLLALLFAFTPFLPAVDKDRHVVFITIDGIPSDLWNDPAMQLPNLRRLAAEGATAKAMTVSNPSLTWINHTTLITGVEPRKHGVLFNGLLIRQGEGKPPVVEQWAPKDQMVFAPTLYDLAHAAGLSTAESNWVAITNASTIDWSFAELPRRDSTVVRNMIASGAASEKEIEWMQPGPSRKSAVFLDAMWTRAAIHILETYRPNLLLYHTLNTDSTHHQYGPRTQAGFSALEYADRLVGDVIAAVDRSGIREKTTIIVTTDHGFKHVAHFVQPNVVLKEAGLAKGFGPSINACSAYVMGQGGMGFVYITEPARRAELLLQVKELLSKTKGISFVIDGDEGHRLGMPIPSENPGMGDLILYAEDGFAIRSTLLENQVVIPSINYRGSHGFLNSDPDLDGFFIISGAGIRKGVELARIHNVDVAPTVAKLMKLEFPNTDGRVLDEVLLP